MVPTPRGSRVADLTPLRRRLTANLVGALAAERKVCSLDSGNIGVADQVHGDGLMHSRAACVDQFPNFLFRLREIGFLAGFQFGAAQGEE